MDIWQRLFALDNELQLLTKRFVAMDATYKHIPNAFLAGSSTEVGMLCRSLPTRIFEMEFDVMLEYGVLNEAMGREYSDEVKDQLGYYRLKPSTEAEYLSRAPLICTSTPKKHDGKEYAKLIQVFKDTTMPFISTSQVKELLESFERAADPDHTHSSISDGPSAVAKQLFIDELQYDLQTSPLLYCFVQSSSSVISTDGVFCLAKRNERRQFIMDYTHGRVAYICIIFH